MWPNHIINKPKVPLQSVDRWFVARKSAPRFYTERFLMGSGPRRWRPNDSAFMRPATDPTHPHIITWSFRIDPPESREYKTWVPVITLHWKFTEVCPRCSRLIKTTDLTKLFTQLPSVTHVHLDCRVLSV
jgi:hypothetical protein